jgi:hypothetical protein
MDITGITVCVDYSDIIEHMLCQNAKFLKTWYIVTSPADSETIQLLGEASCFPKVVSQTPNHHVDQWVKIRHLRAY